MSEVPARRSLAEQSNVFENKDSAFVTALKTGLEQSPINKPIIDDQLWFSIHDAWSQTMSNTLSAEEALDNAQEQMTQYVAESQNDSNRDTGTIVVATPVIPPKNVRVIRFGTFMDQQITPILPRFVRDHPDIQVELIPADMSIGADVVPDFLQMANQTDCFTWPTSLPVSVLTATLKLDPFMDADSTFNAQDYPQALFTPFERENSMYGLPWYIQLQALAYNEALFQTTGVTPPASDLSLGDFRDLAFQMTGTTEAQQHYGYGLTFAGPQDIRFFLDQFGASISRNGSQGPEPDFTNTNVIHALTYYVTLLQQASAYQELPGYKGGAMIDVISNGKTAMWLTYTASGDNVRSTERGGFTTGFVVPPLADHGAHARNIRVAGMYISAQSQNSQACWTWLTYLSHEATAVAIDSLPARRSVAQSQTFTARISPETIELYESYLPILDNPRTFQSQDLFSDHHFDPYWLYLAIDNAIQGQDLEAELQTAQDLTQLYLQCVRNSGEYDACAKTVDSSYQGIGPLAGW